VDKAEDLPHIGKQFVPPMMDPVLGDYARNVPDARESEVLSLFATIINKYACSLFILCHGRMFFLSVMSWSHVKFFYFQTKLYLTIKIDSS
jgi:hypothetical protein